MSEFVNRMGAQRAILRSVNRLSWPKEPLYGLSNNAIDRWISGNELSRESRIPRLVRNAAELLFFLASQSQEQVSEAYVLRTREVEAICIELDSIG
jgi:hypothetical protein